MSEKQTTEEILSEVESRLRNAGIIPHDLEMEVGGEYSFYCRLGRDTVLARANAAGFKCRPLIGGDYLIFEREDDPLPPTEPQPSALDGGAGDARIREALTPFQDDRMHWWNTLGRRNLTSHDLEPRTDLKPDTLQRWPRMFRENYLVKYEPSSTDNARYDMLDALDVIATLKAQLAAAENALAAAEGELWRISQRLPMTDSYKDVNANRMELRKIAQDYFDVTSKHAATWQPSADRADAEGGE